MTTAEVSPPSWSQAFSHYQRITDRAKRMSDARYTRKWRISLYFARKAGCDSINTCRNWGTELTGERGAFARKALAYFDEALAHGSLYSRVCHLAHNKFMVPAGAARSTLNA